MKAKTPEAERERRRKISEARRAREARRQSPPDMSSPVTRRAIDLPRSHSREEFPEGAILGWLPVAGILIPVVRRQK
jgi:hypothetical protein